MQASSTLISSLPTQHEPQYRLSVEAATGGLSAVPRSLPLAKTLTAKKALLVAISYSGKARIIAGQTLDVPVLDSAHDDAIKWCRILMEKYGYKAEDIVCLMDTPENTGTTLWPSKKNIRTAMEDLVDGLQPGDRRFFFVAAHGAQEVCAVDSVGYVDVSESDGKDEFIWTSEGPGRLGLAKLTDNAIHRSLMGNGRIVKGATLTAVAASCHSGTLLDLPYEMLTDNNRIQFINAKSDPAPLEGTVICIAGCEDAQLSTDFYDPDSKKHVGVLTECFKSLLDQTLTIPINHLTATLTSWFKGAQPDLPQRPVVTCGNKKTPAIFSP